MLFLLLSACLLDPANEGDDPATGAVEGDADGDGYLSIEAGGDDCDDGRPEVHPGATEVCDGFSVDEDCDGGANDDDPEGNATGQVEGYTDADGDGYGSGESTLACPGGPGRAEQAGDCNDQDPAVNPGATEVCDDADLDENCNGLADDADPSLDKSTATTFFSDADGDGYGRNPLAPTCSLPAGAAAAAGDCDDGDGAIHPGAQEVCDPWDVDEDCDGYSDSEDSSVDPASGTPMYDDRDGDGYGAGEPHTDCEADSNDVLTGDDCDDDDPDVSPADNDGDGLSGCDGDCDDTDPYATPEDLDGDGLAGCAGDCDDDDPTITEGCEYISATGTWELPDFGCTLDITRSSVADGSVCPACDWSFEVTYADTSGSCGLGSFEAVVGFAEGTESFHLYFASSYYYYYYYYYYGYSEFILLGTFDARLEAGATYDRLTWYGESDWGNYYTGILDLY